MPHLRRERGGEQQLSSHSVFISHSPLPLRSFPLFLQFPIVCSVCVQRQPRGRERERASGPCNELTGAAGEQPGSRDIKGHDPRLPDQGPDRLGNWKWSFNGRKLLLGLELKWLLLRGYLVLYQREAVRISARHDQYRDTVTLQLASPKDRRGRGKALRHDGNEKLGGRGAHQW